MFLCHPWYQRELNSAAHHTVVKTRGRRELIADVRQDALLLLARELRRHRDLGFDRSRPRDGFPGWIRTIISRHCREALRRLRRQTDRRREAGGEPHAADPTESMTSRLDLQAAIQALGPRERAVVSLSMQGRSIADIASELSEPYQTIYSVWQRALHRLECSLGEEYASVTDHASRGKRR
jgi:RNA polymerase sigma factor (sigma-70 family)